MRKRSISLALVSLMVMFGITSFVPKTMAPKDLIGAWEYGPENNKTVMIVTDRVFSVATYDYPGKKFISSYGGTWLMNGNKLVQTIEWNSENADQVGEEVALNASINGSALTIRDRNQSWTRIDDGTPGDLMGAWVISGNWVKGKERIRSSPFYPRRTMKILSGTRFQWIAYNVESKSFENTGGGSYTTVDGKYTENIEFFTKAAESVGKSLEFNYSFVNGHWRHSGQKSTGGRLDERWTKRDEFESM